MSAVWRFVVTVFETLVFVLIGLSLRGVLGRLGGLLPALESAGPIALVVVLTVTISRLLWMIPGIYVPRLFSASLRARDPAPPPSVALVIGWAGMRGVVSLAAALALPQSFPGRDLLLFATFAVIAVTVLIQGSTLAPLIRLVLKTDSLRLHAPSHDELTARVRVSTASLQYLESIPSDAGMGSPHHARLIEHYRTRLNITNQIGAEGEKSTDLRASHFGVALAALAAGRGELIRLHRSGAIHDSILRAIESELDLEELRLRQLSGVPER
jgi:CPA1 family monovalent cation:H+ antiporter